MIIHKNFEKVKRKAIRLIHSLDREISKPLKKFILEATMRMLTTGSCNINEIAATLGESVKIKYTVKRLHRMLLASSILSYANKLSLSRSQKKITSETIIAIDGSDITHQYGNHFEKSSLVRDGSSGHLKRGYWLNQLSGYNPSTRETYPILLDMYSTMGSGFKSRDLV